MTKSAAWGGKDFPIIAAHGQYASWEEDDLYGYTKGYGMDGDSHPGVDVAMPVGTTLYALADGTVDYIRQESYGTREVVIRTANGHRHLYTHTSMQLVRAGDRVTKRQAIARSGDPTGLPHLHFEHRVPDSSQREKWRIVDPMPLLTAQEGTMDIRLTSKPIRTAQSVYQRCVDLGARDPNNRPGFFKEYVFEHYRLGPLVGINPDWAITQGGLETGNANTGAPFQSAIWRSRGNPGGIGVTDSVDLGYGFPNGKTAARAQMAHLYVYVHGNTNLDPDIAEYVDLDPRWDAVVSKGWAGTVKTVDDLTGKWATDTRYGEKLKARFRVYIEGAENVSDLPGEVIDIIDDVVNEQYAPPVFLDYLEGDDPKHLMVRSGNQAFFRVNAEVEAIRPSPRYQKATQNGLKRGPDMEAGEDAYIEYAFIADDGRLWLYSDHGTRFFGPDFVRIDGKPIEVPKPEPEPEPEPKPDPKPQPKPGEITAENYRDVEDPTILLPPIEWVGSPNFFPNRSGFGKPVAIVDHITDDMIYGNTKSWFQNPGSQASSHFVILRDGSVKQFVSSTDGAFTNGDAKSPRRDIPWLNDLINRRVNLNNATITIEHIGTPSNPPTEAQYRSSIALHRYFCHPKVYGINPDRSHNLRHSDINSVSRSYCPGPRFDKERIIRECGGDPAKVAA